MLAVIYLSGQDASNHDQDLIDTQPHRTVTVVKAERSPLAGRAEGPEVTVDLGDRSVVLGLSFPGEDDVAPGDQLEVVIDPEDPEYVIAANSHADWAYTWWGELLIMLLIGALGGGMWLLWARSVPAKSALRSARRASAVQRVDVVDVDGAQLDLRDTNHDVWAWTADGDEWSGTGSGPTRLVGELGEGTWPVIAAGRLLHWPGQRARRVIRG